MNTFYFRDKYYTSEYSKELSVLWKNGTTKDRSDLSIALAIYLLKEGSIK